MPHSRYSRTGLSSHFSSVNVQKLGCFLFATLGWTATAICQAADHGAAEPKTNPAIYGQGVRETEWQTPAAEQAGFHLPDGFLAELVVSEPAIAKPMNMAFDKQGRLWVTDTIEYPYPAPPGSKGRDSIKVLSDLDRNGTFESITTFVDGLNIPIGILPVNDGVLCFSIPNLVLYRDTNGDGKADESKIILGPFDTSRDTHGMINALRRGPDGWIYACHGYNNQSQVTAQDGSTAKMVSGNTFRFREDGSHIEQFTFGQVNPFGMTADDWNQWFTADCHSKPVTLLLQGAAYESFGRPHQGLGFTPPLMNHLHGSTAICGIQYYQDSSFPEEYRQKFYSGNVMTSRINSNRLQITKDQIKLAEAPDFMTSDDPWFRPVDVQLGPDGCLYIADFYNKIIGHYEVRLNHPERDRTSGRIWRIRYQNNATSTAASSSINDYRLLSEEHWQELTSPHAARRQLALACVPSTRTWSDSEIQNLRERSQDKQASLEQRSAALWLLHRAGMDVPSDLAKIASSEDLRLRAFVYQALQDQGRKQQDPAPAMALLIQRLREDIRSDSPQLALASARALGTHGGQEDVALLLVEANRRPEDSVTRYAMRLAASQLLAREEIAKKVLTDWPGSAKDKASHAIPTDGPIAELLAGILPSVQQEVAAQALLGYVTTQPKSHRELRVQSIRHATKFANERLAQAMMSVLRDSLGNDQSGQLELVKETALALKGNGRAVPDELISLVEDHLRDDQKLALASLRDEVETISWSENRNRMWQSQPRNRKGAEATSFLSSHTLGETYTGVLSTAAFKPLAKLSFWIVGHDGAPNAPAAGRNLVRLVDASSGDVLQQVSPPRNDTGRLVEWDLSNLKDRLVRIEVIDNDENNAYAWLGVAGFSDPRLQSSPTLEPVNRLTQWLAVGIARDATLQLADLLGEKRLALDLRASLISACAANDRLPLSSALADAARSRSRFELVSVELLSKDSDQRRIAQTRIASTVAQLLSQAQQTSFAKILIASSDGRALLLALVDNGALATSALRGLADLIGNNPKDPDTVRLVELATRASEAPSDLENQIAKRIASINTQDAEVELGRAMFTKHCANCHKLSGVGQLIGPQLDGVIARGNERLGEDILLPNRNVDKSFRISSLLLEDDQVLVGLVRESADGKIEIIGSDGKSKPVDPKSIASRRDTTRSLMPENFTELLSDKELAALIRFISTSKPAE